MRRKVRRNPLLESDCIYLATFQFETALSAGESRSFWNDVRCPLQANFVGKLQTKLVTTSISSKTFFNTFLNKKNLFNNQVSRRKRLTNVQISFDSKYNLNRNSNNIRPSSYTVSRLVSTRTL